MTQIIQGQAFIPSFNSHVPGAGFPNPDPDSSGQSNPQTDNLADSIAFVQPAIPPEGCPDYTPQTYLISQDPRMIYIESFLTEEERLHLVSQSEPNYTPAYVVSDNDDTATTDETVRKSETAGLDRDTVVRCIEHRARTLQPHWENKALEPLSVQRYTAGGFFTYHLDALQVSPTSVSPLPNRKSTFNVWLDGNCTGGGTHFPAIPRAKNDDPVLCGWINCTVAKGNGTIFRPIAGNAVFWEGIRDDEQSLYQETVHAGLAVERGTKIGLNIWTWVFDSKDPRGGGGGS
ncbi:hypothetical protein BJX65DRAFT_300939 [Aspergillus insuetus]